MAEKSMQKDRYKKPMRMEKKDGDEKKPQPDAEPAVEHTEQEGGSQGKPEASVTAGTDGIKTSMMDRHHEEITDMHGRHGEEMAAMHDRHAKEHKAMTKRHGKEMAEHTDREGAEEEEGKEGTEPE